MIHRPAFNDYNDDDGNGNVPPIIPMIVFTIIFLAIILLVKIYS